MSSFLEISQEDVQSIAEETLGRTLNEDEMREVQTMAWSNLEETYQMLKDYMKETIH